MSDVLSPEDLQALDKEVKKLKRIASEWASQMHDLVEDRLPSCCQDISAPSQSTYDACLGGVEASARLASAQKGRPA